MVSIKPGTRQSELELLAETCRMLDSCDALRAVLDREGVTSVGSTRQPRIHPAVGELRQARLAVGRLLGQLALPGEDDKPAVSTVLSARGRHAAMSRWGGREGREARRRGPAA
jgi:Trm5-related predicted tRNA methylase